MSKRVLCIEISNALTKICEMENKSKRPRVYKCVSFRTPENVIVDGMLQPTESFKDMLSDCLLSSAIKTKKVIFTITSPRIASREVQIPHIKENRIEAVIKANASDYFPIDLQEYEIGYYKVGAEAEQNKLRVMALAVPKPLLEGYQQLADMCGMELLAFDYSSNSLYQIVKNKGIGQVTMVLKVDETNTVVTILNKNRILLQRNISYGVDEPVETLLASNAYPAETYDEAVELFKSRRCINKTLYSEDRNWEERGNRWVDEDAGNQAVNEAKQAVTASFELLVNGIKRLLDYYESQNSELAIESVYLTGLGGEFRGLNSLLTSCMERKVVVLTEINEVNMTRTARDTGLGEYVSCLGAVLNPVGLIDKEMRKQSSFSLVSGTNYTFVSVSVLAIGVILAGSMSASALVRYYQAVAEQKMLTEQIRSLEPVKLIYNEYLAAKGQHDKYQAFYQQTQTHNENLVAFINELEEILPGSFLTNSFSSDDAGISMTVTVEGKSAAARTIKNIRDMESIEVVEVSGLNDSLNELGQSQVTFSVRGVYAPLNQAENEEQ